MNVGTALVLGDYVQSVVVVRSLAHAGFRVLIGHDGRFPLAGASRHCSGTWTHPPLDSDAFASALQRFLDDEGDVGCIFPVGEEEAIALAAHPELGTRAPIAMPGVETLTHCLHKPSATEVAAACFVPVPGGALAANRDDLYRRAEAVGAPFVVKCPDSSSKLGEYKALRCDDLAALERARPLLDGADWPLLVQRFIEGERRNCQFAAIDGELFAYFEDRTLRTDRPDGTGYAVEGESVAPTPGLRAYCEALAGALGYNGVGCAQFLVEPTTGDAVFLELNPRLDATCELAYACGIDFPKLAVHCARRAIPASAIPSGYRVGKRFHWLLADLRGVVGGARRGRFPRRDLAKHLGALAGSFFQADCQLGWRWSDPLPASWYFTRELASVRPRVGLKTRHS